MKFLKIICNTFHIFVAIFRKLIEYEITKLKKNEDVLKELVESNYWKQFCQINPNWSSNTKHLLVKYP